MAGYKPPMKKPYNEATVMQVKMSVTKGLASKIEVTRRPMMMPAKDF